MSSQELRAFFPSPAHPALPIAAQLLSTLRNLTGPGKGVNLKPEERTALVGVAALLGCEKVQSKDLSESSAQKASHVAPSQFRAALSLSRRLISSASTAASDAISSPRKSSPSKSKTTDHGEPSSEAAARATAAAALSPFSTPRKKFRPAASGVDLSGLNSRGGTGAHSPAKGSPLKQSVTPSSSRRPQNTPITVLQPAGDEDQEEEVEEEEEIHTPSKKANIATMRSPGGGSGRKRRGDESTNAFFALRPGSMVTPPDLSMSGTSRRRERSASPTPRREALGMMSAKRRSHGEKKRLRKLRKVDWTFHEEIWGGSEVHKRNDAVLEKVRKVLENGADGQLHLDLRLFLSAHDIAIPPSAEKSSVADILLQALQIPSQDMEVDP